MAESGQWLENVDGAYLVLASGKPLLQKRMTYRLTLSADSGLLEDVHPLHDGRVLEAQVLRNFPSLLTERHLA